MEFRDLKAQYAALKTEIDAAVQEVCRASNFISGKQVKELEQELADYVGARHCITCANGTDAITLGLKAWNIGPGDAVFVPDFTFFSSGECPAALGALPVFVDVDKRTYNMDAARLEEAVKEVIAGGKYKPRAVVAVDLFGLSADYNEIRPVCEKYNLLLLEDAAQGFGGSINGRKACSFGDISTTSFFPAKPLGCYGDGGAIFTENDEWAAQIRSLAVHGKNGSDKYDNMQLGMNSRLDTIQAAILLPKFRAFRDYELEAVNKAAGWYNEALKDSGLVLPEVKEGFISSWAQYTVQLPENIDRSAVQQKLKEQGIPSMVYYTKPMHSQRAFAGTDSEKADCPVTEKLCRVVLSLPMHPYLTKEMADNVAQNLSSLLK